MNLLGPYSSQPILRDWNSTRLMILELDQLWGMTHIHNMQSDDSVMFWFAVYDEFGDFIGYY